ncbi:restriction endonuclease [Maribacter ulvicola]|uniref:Restriction endonuclease n=1 Tax=Maribacter ulvicola TaxID=228959 RepID=A0A1N6QRL1_9FLAO|nr:hypothetical protein [Maribacter ulvicola]SIQ19178.1 Restriction endonuclease [Maribacter ulvicola]
MMKASQSLPRPENWQDFEKLCKKLWGEVWNCPEIMRNGRSGQDQAGIDIYGVPRDETSYYGIQCKGKDEYTGKQLTEKEIHREIEKAKKFEPNLKKMYFATTAVRDAGVQTIIRKINVQHIKEGLFEVNVYAWEDIVDLIFENKSTYDYYLNSNTFKTNQSVKVSFMNGETEMTVIPKFVHKILIAATKYDELERQAKKMIPDWIGKMADKHWITPQIFDTSFPHIPNRTEFNRSFIDGTILVTNDGSEPLEHWKLVLSLPEQIKEISRKNYEKKGGYLISGIGKIPFDTYFDTDNHLIEIEPRKKILVGDDSFSSDPIYMKPLPKNITIKIPWKLVSKNFKHQGVLILHVEPDIDISRVKVDDNSPLLLDESKRSTIEDYIEKIDDE